MFAKVSKLGLGAVARAAVAVSLVAAGSAVMLPGVAAAKEAAPKAGAYSKEFIAAAAPVQKSVNAVIAAKGKNAPEAEIAPLLTNIAAEMAAAEAAIKTPADRAAAGQWAINVGGWIKDIPMRQRGVQNMLDSGQVPAERVLEYKSYLGQFAYNNKDYATAVTALTDVVKGNYKDDGMAEVLAQSLTNLGKPAEALDALKMAVDARKAAGGVVPSDWYSRATLIAYKAKLGPQAVDWAIGLAELQPTALNWLNAGQFVRDYGTFTNNESLDLGRLLIRSGALKEDPKFTTREFVEYIQAADPRRLPGEVVKVAQLGLAQKALQSNDRFVTDALTQAQGRIAADKASLASYERDARLPNATAATTSGAGDVFLSYDDPAKAAEFYSAALTKPGVDTDRVLTRLGIAQVDMGKFAEAQATFAKVQGPARKNLARLWASYAAFKAKPDS